MPTPDKNIDTGSLGLALSILTPSQKKNPFKDKYLIEFDTGIVLAAPLALFDNMLLHLREAD